MILICMNMYMITASILSGWVEWKAKLHVNELLVSCNELRITHRYILSAKALVHLRKVLRSRVWGKRNYKTLNTFEKNRLL